MRPQVILTPDDFFRAVRFAKECYQANRTIGTTDRTVSELGPISMDIRGRSAELAVMRWAGVPEVLRVAAADGSDWTEVAKEQWDVPGVAEVRSTHHAAGRLLIQRSDPDDRPFVLALTDRLFGGLVVELAGWVMGADGKQQRWWEPRMKRPCFAVPQSALSPMNDLPTLREESA